MKKEERRKFFKELKKLPEEIQDKLTVSRIARHMRAMQSIQGVCHG